MRQPTQFTTVAAEVSASSDAKTYQQLLLLSLHAAWCLADREERWESLQVATQYRPTLKLHNATQHNATHATTQLPTQHNTTQNTTTIHRRRPPEHNDESGGDQP